MKTRYIIYTLLALLVAFLIYNKFFSEHAKKTAAAMAAGGKGGGKKGGRNTPIPVRVQIIKDTTLNNTIDVTGTIDANEKVTLISEIAGSITGIFFTEGGTVKKGQLLVKVYDKDLTSSLKQTEYQIQLAKTNEYRNKILLQKEAISQQEYDTSLTTLNTLTAQVDGIKAQIARRQILAPFSGTIGLRNVSPGSYLSPSTTIATLINIDPAKVTFSVPERYLSLIKIGTKISFAVESSRDNFKATVYAIEPDIDLSSRTITVRAKAPNPKGKLRAGSFAKINLALDQIPKTIMIPTECVIPDLKSSKVYIAHNGVATAKPVKTDLRTDTKIQIISGLKAGDSLIVSGIMQLKPKAPLKITKVIQ